MSSIAKQKPPNHEFLNCEFEFECRKNWFDLTPTYDSKVKYCETCNKDVHLCVTQEELDKHAALRHCIACFKDPDLDIRFRLQGEVCEDLVPGKKVKILTGYPASAKRLSEIFNEDDE